MSQWTSWCPAATVDVRADPLDAGFIARGGIGLGCTVATVSVVVALTRVVDRASQSSPWPPREAEFLGLTLGLPKQPGLIQNILQQAVERGEIEQAAISNELWGLLPGYLIFRSIMVSRPPNQHTGQPLVDDVTARGQTVSPSCRKANV